MTGADFTGVDIDLLADYVGGALQGTPDEGRVAALIAGEPAWRDAYALLSEGMAEVGDSLHAWGALPEPMPTDVIARLDGALRGDAALSVDATLDTNNVLSADAALNQGFASSATDTASGATADGAVNQTPALGASDTRTGIAAESPVTVAADEDVPGASGEDVASGTGTAVGEDLGVGDDAAVGRRPALVGVSAAPSASSAQGESPALSEAGGGAGVSGPGSAAVRKNVVDLRGRRRRAVRWGGSFAAAAAVVAVAGVGVAYLASGSQSADDATSSAAGAGQAEGLASLPPGAVTSSNTDYSAATLSNGPIAPLSAGSGVPTNASKSQPQTALSSDAARASGGGLVDGLARLRPQPALQECLDAIAAENGAGPVTVQSVDYARFAGQAALVVSFTATNGRWAWVSGPDCGLPTAGASTAYSVQVG